MKNIYTVRVMLSALLTAVVSLAFSQNKIINVNLYGTASYVNSAWNNWNVVSSLTSPALKYSDGSSTSITSVLSAQGGYSDNGATYPVTMCPQQVGRDASYATSTRTNTLNGLDNTKLYDIQLYASRGNAGQTTRFTVNGTNVDIATNSNFTNIATFSNIAPSAGKIVITLANLATYNYLNGFTLTEKPGAGGTNQSPVANAGTGQTITLPTNTATLTGSGTDADGTIASYAWTQTGGTAATITSPSSATTTITGLTTTGTRTFTLTVTDNLGATGTSTVTVTVNPANPTNQPPVANAGSNQSITLPTNTATLTGSGTDADGTIASYAWSQTGGTAATITSPGAATTTITGLTTAGTRTFLLTVTDNQGGTGTATVTVTVNAGNQSPVANAGSNQSITLPTNTATLTGSGTDADGSMASYGWSQTGGTAATITSPGSATTTITGLTTVGTRTFLLTVTDNQGATGTATVTVTVNAGNQSPVANAGSNQTITLPTNTATLTGSGTDADGTVASYAWSQTGGTAATITSPGSATTTITGLTTTGVRTFLLTVTDNQGATGTGSVTITVNAAVNQSPVANAGSNQTITLPTNTATLTGSGTDADGTVASYAWSQTGGTAATITSPGSATTTITGLTTTGVRTFLLTVRDNLGATGTASVTVTVNAAATTSILNRLDPVITYNAASPPTQPAYGTIGKWVRTKRLNWNTDSFKCYIYKGRPFRLKYPKTYNPTAADGKVFPMFVFFHGAGEGSTNLFDNEYQLAHGGSFFNTSVDNGTFDGYILTLQTTASWGVAEYADVRELIDYMTTNNKLDQFRVYTNGLSAGAQGTWEMYINYPTYIAGLIPMSGVYSAYSDPSFVNKVKYTPIWNFHGGKDGAPAPSTAAQVTAAMAAQGAKYVDVMYADLGHGTWDRVWSEPGFWPFYNKAYMSNPWALFGRTDFCTGDPINVTVGVVAGFNGYRWRKDGTVIPGATSNSIQVTALGVYDCQVLKGSTWSDWSHTPVTIKIKAPTVTPNIAISGLMSKVIPAPDGNTGVNLKVPSGYASYLWQKVPSTSTIGTDSILRASTAGNYIVKVSELFGCSSSFSAPFAVVDANGPNKPDAASNLTVSVLSQTSLKLNWNQNPSPTNNETGFEVYQGTKAGGPYTLKVITAADATGVTIAGLNANTKYYYIVRAVNGTGASPSTAEASATTVADTKPPTAPANLAIAGSTASSISISWGASTDDVGVTEYNIYVNGVKSYTVPPTARSFTVYSLQHKQSYALTVKALDLAGNVSPASNQVSGQALANGLAWNYYNGLAANLTALPNFTTLAPVATGYSPNVTLSPATDQINYGFLWQGYIVIPTTGNYVFRTNSDDGSRLWLGSLNGTASPYSFSGTPVVNNDGLHGAQNVNSSTRSLQAGIYPIAIGYFQIGGGASMSISWRTPSSGNNFVTIPNSAFSETAANNGTAPSAPSGLSTAAGAYNKINLNWTDNSNNETGFEVWRSTSSSTGFIIVGTTAAAIHNYVDSTVNASTQYFYKVRAINLYGASAYSNTPPGATTPALPAAPAAPSGLVATGVGTSSVHLGWTINSNNETGYQVYRSNNNNLNYVLLTTLPPGSVAYNDQGLFANAIYYYRVNAFNIGGSTASNADSALTLDNPPVISDVSNRSVRYGTTTSLSITATDADPAPLNFTGQNLPSFASLVDNGNSTATLTFNPVIGDQGPYSGLRVIVHNTHGGADTTEFEIIVNDNYAPVIDAIGNYTMNENGNLTIPLHATDQNASDVLTWTVASLPSAFTVTPGSNGSASLSLHPNFAASGAYAVQVAVSDGNGGSATNSFTLTVNDVTPPTTKVYLRFKNTLTAPAPWNNITGLSTSGLKGDDGSATSIGLQIQGSWFSTFNNGPNTGNNSGVYPDAVLNEYLFFGQYPGTFTGPNTVTANFTGLDLSRRYTVSFHGASVWPVQANNGITTFTIGSTTESLNVQNNTQNLATFSNLQAAADGTLTFTAGLGANTPVGYLNAIVLTSVYDDGSVPVTPQAFIAQDAPGQGVNLSWQDVAYNESGYEMYRSLSAAGPFALVGQAAANATGFTDTTTGGNSLYYYRARSINSYGASDSTPVVAVTTSDRVPRINAIGNVLLRSDQQTIVNVTAVDDASDHITLSVANLPSFASFADNGNGTGTITIAPQAGSIGTFPNVTVTATDNSDSSRSTMFDITIVDKNVSSTYVMFSGGPVGPRPWNSFINAPVAGASLTNLVDDGGAGTGMSVNLVDGFQWFISSGMRPGNNSTIYPEAVIRNGFYETSTATHTLTVNGLSASRRYNFVFFNSHDDGFKCLTNFTINGQTVSLNATYNINKTVQINGIAPDANGKVTIAVAKASGQDYAFLTTMIIQSYDPAVVSLLSPSDLRVAAVARNSVSLQWADRASGETGIEVWRASSNPGSYSLVTTLPANSTSYTDGGRAPNTTYYYTLRSVQGAAQSDYSGSLAATTLVNAVYINFANGNQSPIPWNNTNTTPQQDYEWDNFYDELGVPTNTGMVVTENFDGLYSAGVQTGNNSGIFPDKVMFDSYGLFPGNTGALKVTGLNLSQVYDFSFFGSTTVWGDVNTTYTINGQSAMLNTSVNSTATVTLYGIHPDENGEVNIVVTPGTAFSQFGLLGAMIVQGYTPPAGGAPAVPVSTLVIPNGRTSQGAVLANVAAGEDSVLKSKQVRAYPNPFRESFTLVVPAERGDNVEVLLYDMAGRLVYGNKFSNLNEGDNNLTIRSDRSIGHTGVYFVRVVYLNKESKMEKVIRMIKQ